MAEKLILNINSDKFQDFVLKLQDLTNISDTIKLKIDNDNILAYSMLSNDVAVLALKNYSLPTSDYITNFDSDKIYDYIITGASKFVKNLKFFNTSQPIKLQIAARAHPDDEDIMHVRSSTYSNGKLKISCVGGELSKMRDINKDTLAARLDPKKSLWGFNMSKEDFVNVKKLSSINSEDRIINTIVESGKVSMMEEYKWEMEVDTIDKSANHKIIFNKKYLSNINDEKDVNFQIFETFILVADDNSNLMLSFETDFSEVDE